MKKTYFLPGFTGSVLSDAAGEVFHAAKATMNFPIAELRKRPPEDWTPLLSIAYDAGAVAPRATSLIPGVRIYGSSEITYAYDRLRRKGCTMWAFDWRLDVRYLAAQLIAQIERNQEACDIVAHSYGCHVAVVAYELAPADTRELIGKVALVAPPFAGTMRAVTPLAFGPADLYKQYRTNLRKACVTWCALYQMLPHAEWNAVVDGDGSPLPAAAQLGELGGWPDPILDEDAMADMLERTRIAQRLLESGVRRLTDESKIYALFGDGQATPITMRRDGDTMIEESHSARGDGLVPLELTRNQWHQGILSQNSEVIHGQRHALMCEDDLVLSRLFEYLDI